MGWKSYLILHSLLMMPSLRIIIHHALIHWGDDNLADIEPPLFHVNATVHSMINRSIRSLFSITLLFSRMFMIHTAYMGLPSAEAFTPLQTMLAFVMSRHALLVQFKAIKNIVKRIVKCSERSYSLVVLETSTSSRIDGFISGNRVQVSLENAGNMITDQFVSHIVNLVNFVAHNGPWQGDCAMEEAIELVFTSSITLLNALHETIQIGQVFVSLKMGYVDCKECVNGDDQ
jgi:hypothetical protein